MTGGSPTPAPGYTHEGLRQGQTLREGWEVSPRQVEQMRHAGEDLVLLDCRLPREHELVHIDGAQLVPLQAMPQQAEQLTPLRERKVVVYCHHGMRSLQATAYLRQLGFTDVHSMAGGIDAWAAAIEPRLPRY